MAAFLHDDAVELYFDNTKKLQTQSTGVRFVAAHTFMDDNYRARFGANDDLQIYHDGSNSFLKNDTGTLNIQSDTLRLTDSDLSHIYLKGTTGAATELYYDNSKKLETTSSGITVTGGVAASAFSVGDNQEIKLGDSNDLKLFHNGSHSYIADLGTGDLRITGSAIHLQDAAQSENMFRSFENGAVELYYDGALQANTRSDGFEIKQHLTMGDSDEIRLGNSGDLKIYHDGTNSAIQNTVGELLIYGGNDEIRIQAENTEDNLIARPNGSTELFFDNSKKLETTSGGVGISGFLDIPSDSSRLRLGASDDLQIYHDGSGSSIENATGQLAIACDDAINLQSKTGAEYYFRGFLNDRSELYYDNSKKLNTISNGVAINTTATTSTSSSSTASLVLDGDGNAYQIAFNDVGLNADRGFIMKAVSGVSAVVGAVFVDEGNDGCGSISFGDAGTTFATSSDYRIKENITNITNAITRLKQLKPYRFNFKKDSTRTVDGFLAHEAQTVVPEAVTGTKDEVDSKGNPIIQGIDQSKLVPLLVAAVQELTAKVEALEAA